MFIEGLISRSRQEERKIVKAKRKQKWESIFLFFFWRLDLVLLSTLTSYSISQFCSKHSLQIQNELIQNKGLTSDTSTVWNKKKRFIPWKCCARLKASASTNLNPHTIYPKQFLKDKKIEQLSEKHMNRRFKGVEEI